MNTAVENAISRLSNAIIEEAVRNPDFANSLQNALAGSESGSAIGANSKPDTPKRRRRRDPATLNPIDMILENQEKLLKDLEKLSEKALKDIIAEYRLEPSQRVMRWRNREKLIQLILEAAHRRAAQGDAFRQPNNKDTQE